MKVHLHLRSFFFVSILTLDDSWSPMTSTTDNSFRKHFSTVNLTLYLLFSVRNISRSFLPGSLFLLGHVSWALSWFDQTKFSGFPPVTPTPSGTLLFSPFSPLVSLSKLVRCRTPEPPSIVSGRRNRRNSKLLVYKTQNFLSRQKFLMKVNGRFI